MDFAGKFTYKLKHCPKGRFSNGEKNGQESDQKLEEAGEKRKVGCLPGILFECPIMIEGLLPN
jgi:hypothetical protein